MNTEINHKVMTEAAIERAAERHMDRLDRRLMHGRMTQGEYNNEVEILDAWVKARYEEVRR